MNNEYENGFDYYDGYPKKKEWEQKKKEKSNRFCIISSLCMGAPILTACFILIVPTIFTEIWIGTFVELFNVVTMIIAYILMIYVRIRYSENGYGKVLMWVYIGMAIVEAVWIILCYSFFDWINSCTSGFW